jgi:hypothetical protein
MAIRKNHTKTLTGLKRGDLFEVVLIQTKGGASARPTSEDVSRLSKVAKYYAAKVVLAEWKRGEQLEIFELKRKKWASIDAAKIFR